MPKAGTPGDDAMQQEQAKKQAGRPAPSPLEALPGIASRIAGLDPGPAAALRLGPHRGAGAAAFWNLLPADMLISENIAEEEEKNWAAWFQCAAILTPRGRNPNKKSAHNPAMPMGRALHDAGVSEERLARLLATPAAGRGGAAATLCRRIAAGNSGSDGKRSTGFDLVTLGKFILSGDEKTDRRIARDYYRAKNFKAKKETKEKEKEHIADA